MNVLMILHFKTFIFAIIFLSQTAWAVSSVNQGMVFEGSLTDNSGNAIDLQSQQLYFYVTAFDSIGKKCILYAESSTTSGDSTGLISHRYGSGVAVTSPVSYNNTISNSIFAGAASGKLADGSGAACSVVSGSTRYVDVYSAVLDITGSIVLGTTPYSNYADNASSLNGKLETDFVAATSLSGGSPGQVLSRVGSTGFAWMTPSAGTVSSIDLSTASATGIIASARLADVVTAGSYLKVTVDTKGRVTSGATALSTNDIATGTLPVSRGGTGMTGIGLANTLFAVNNSGTAYEHKAIAGGYGIAVSSAAGAINVNLAIDTSHVVTALGFSPANRSGDAFTGDTAFLQKVSVGHNAPIVSLDVAGTIKIGNGGEACISTLIGAFRYSSGAMQFCNGTAWQSLAVNGVTAVADSSIDSSKIQDGSIVTNDLANGSVTYSKLALVDNDIPQSKINGLGASFTAKENAVTAGNTSQYYRGDKSWQSLNTGVVSEATNLYFTEPRVRSSLLTGYTVGSDSAVVPADTILQGFAKLQGQIDARWQTSNSNMYFNNGSVNIGTTATGSTKLFVKNIGSASGLPVAYFEQYDDSAYNATLPVVKYSRRAPAGNVPQAGFGSSIYTMAETDNFTLTTQNVILSRWVNASNSSSYSSYEILTKDSSGTLSAKFYMDQNGVQIPSTNLAVAGSIRIGSDNNANRACVSSEAGKQRYNSSVKAMEFCDGSNWRGINGITYCDSGYSMVGPAGTPSAFCIDTTIGSNQSYENASAVCNSRSPSSGSKAKVCSTQQLDTTCENYNQVSPTLANFNTTAYHWTSTSIPVGGSTNYPKNVFVAYNSSNASTCHLQPTNGISPYNGRISDSANLNTTMNFRCCYE